jgi:hypothetical protein
MKNSIVVETAQYIVDNQSTREKACKKFGITKKMLAGRVAVLKEIDRTLYNQVHEVLDGQERKHNSLPLYLRVAEYVLNSRDCWYGTMEHFDISDKELYDALRYLKSKNEAVYNRVAYYMYE